MSVGGVIVGLDRDGHGIHVSVAERAPWKTREPKLDLANVTAVRVDPQGHTLKLGDTLWWQGRRAMWTPHEKYEIEHGKEGVHRNIVLERLGYSHKGSVDQGFVDNWISTHG